MGVFADPEGAVFCVWQPRPPRPGGGQRAWRCELQQPAHRRCRGRTGLLRRRVSARRRSTSAWPMSALQGYGGPSRGARPRHARGDEADRRARRLRERRGDDLAPRRSPSASSNMTFAVDSVDTNRCASARTRRLGNITQPAESPSGFECTVLADPVGASFIASQFSGGEPLGHQGCPSARAAVGDRTGLLRPARYRRRAVVTTSKISPSVRSPRSRSEWIASIAAWISASRCGPGIS